MIFLKDCIPSSTASSILMHHWQFLTQLWTKLQQPGLMTTLARGASTALIIQGLGVGINYSTQVFLARWLGVSEYGTYEYVVTIATVLGLLAGLGLSSTVLRFVSEYSTEYSTRQNWSHLRGIIWSSWGQTLVAGLAIGLVSIGVLLSLGSSISLILGMGLIPLFALAKIQLEMVRGVKRIALGYAPFFVLYPLLLLGFGLIWVALHQPLDSPIAVTLTIGALMLVLVGQFSLFLRHLPAQIHRVQPTFALRQWLGMSLPLLFIDSSYMILRYTDTLMLGAFGGPHEVGLYSAALKTADWVNFILASVNAIAAPMFASLYVQGDLKGLQRLVSTIARWMFYPAFGVAIGLVVFAEPILGLFGPEFLAAKWAMVALIVGQLVNVGAGSVGYLLLMTGHHYPCAIVVGCSAVVNILLNLVGIPVWGGLGAALATAFSMSLWNVWLHRLVVKYSGVNPSIVTALRMQV